MRTLEIILLIVLFFSTICTLFSSNKKLVISLATLSIVLSGISYFLEGFRFAMVIPYILEVILFIFGVIKLWFYKGKKRPIMKGIFAVVFSLIYILSIIILAFFPVINLPKPGGSYSVGTIKMDFIEKERKDILTGNTSPEKIAVQVWYPSNNSMKKRQTSWIESRKAISLFAKINRLPDIFGQLSLIRTNSHYEAELSNNESKYPVVLFSGGAGMFNGQNTIQMEELASRGYVVFAVSHPYDDFATVCSDKNVMPYSEDQSAELVNDTSEALAKIKNQISDENSPEFQREVIRNCKLNTENVRVWSDDMRFVADEITDMNSGKIKSIFEGRLDTDNMGIFGHSFGGAAAGEACLHDSRFKAFINLDGTPFGDTVDKVIKQPFMVLSAGSDKQLMLSPGNGYAKDQKNFQIVSINGTQHMNFSDFNTIIPRLGKTLGVLGSIEESRQRDIMNTCIVSFFDKYLKGINEPSLNSILDKYSEVKFEKM